MKKTWESPKLIVLVRSRPEESLVTYCKSGAAVGSSPTDYWVKCAVQEFPSCVVCCDFSNS